MTRLNTYLRQSAALIEAMVERDFSQQMEEAAGKIATALGKGLPLLTCGNGGSAADAIHIAGELVGRFLHERKAFPVIALPECSAVVTAWSNDYSFETAYARQVEAHGHAGGVLLALSTSGNSPNILKAAVQAKVQGMDVVALTGETGGKLATLSDVLFNLPSQSTPLIQQGHICIYHMLCEIVEERLMAA